MWTVERLPGPLRGRGPRSRSARAPAGARRARAAGSAYCSEFGTPIRHVATLGRDPFIPEHPSILPITNRVPEGVPAPTAASHWHTDHSYEAEASSATLMYAIEVPRQGGETRFVDMVAAYRGLPETMRREIEPLWVEHEYGAGIAVPEEDALTPGLRTEAQRRPARAPPAGAPASRDRRDGALLALRHLARRGRDARGARARAAPGAHRTLPPARVSLSPSLAGRRPDRVGHLRDAAQGRAHGARHPPARRAAALAHQREGHPAATRRARLKRGMLVGKEVGAWLS